MSTKKEIIILGCHVGGLCVIRALGISGINSIALTYDPFDSAYTSKYVIEKIKVPHPQRKVFAVFCLKDIRPFLFQILGLFRRACFYLLTITKPV
jgi:predicted ATP-grasp superfamily ATP-dependent carboligase